MAMKRRMNAGKRLQRLLSWFLALVLTAGLLPLAQPKAAAVSLDYALQKAVEWGFMRGSANGDLREGDPITRAEFVTIVNRAFGYKAMAGEPFTDVSHADWYGEDVDIAYTEGYINGTTPTRFSPRERLTREQATVILCRNLRMQAEPGEDVSFSDSRQLSDYSRGLIEQAVRYNVVSGYPDGTFRPKNAITRGAAAILLVNAIGTPVQTPGEHALGGVYGNLTITSSGVTLRDTTVTGNLYISDGVDMGSVTLENVTVLGQIIIAGGGSSESGRESIVLRNVSAQELIVDNIRGNQISLGIHGDGVIQKATIRTDAFVHDNTPDGAGLLNVTLDGQSGTVLSLAGNVKKVVNKTPGSRLSLGSGSAASITVDEKAVGSTLDLAPGTVTDELHLDTGVPVTGTGDIDHLTVNAPGCSVPTLPDQIVIRPGISADINGEPMDNKTAAEASATPRMMAGYPRVTDLAPTSATAEFSANKKGTVHWALTSITDGSVKPEDLIKPPAYSGKILKSGTVSLTASGAVGSGKLTGLVSDGSYYLSSVFVDQRGDQSPLKVVSFTTPDNTAPNFASGYPYLSRITNLSAQVTVMPTKSCQLYYAVLPKGASAPRPEDFKANAITGNLGFGVMPVAKNTSYSFDVNDKPLEELASYDLYLWLTDLDNGQSSAVKKLSFTTVDRTPPVFNTDATVKKAQTTSVELYANINENGTIYWVVVEEGTPYPKPMAGQPGDRDEDLTSLNSRLQVVNGMNALKSGKVSASADKDASFTVSGLSPEKAYDLYYIAQDKAGNYSATVKKLTIHTLDSKAPTVTQEFTKYNGTDAAHPLPDTDIRIVFSEGVKDAESGTILRKLYEDVEAAHQAGNTAEETKARETMAQYLEGNIKLFEISDGVEKVIPGCTKDMDKNADAWTIDYRYATVEMEEGKTVVTFPTKKDLPVSALHLKSGSTYFFEIQGIADTSTAGNIMGTTRLPKFTTVFAQVNLSTAGNTDTYIDPDTKQNPIDAYWRVVPVSTKNVDPAIDWDTILWSDTSISFNVWQRTIDENGKAGPWTKVNTKGEVSVSPTPDLGVYGGLSYSYDIQGNERNVFEDLNKLDEGKIYEYALSFTKVKGLPDRTDWSGTVNLKVNAVAGSASNLNALASAIETSWDQLVGNGVTNIGQPETLEIHVPFQDTTSPQFTSGHPTFQAGDSSVRMSLLLSRPGTVYYVVAPLKDIPTKVNIDQNGDGDYEDPADLKDANIAYFDEQSGTYPNYEKLPKNGNETYAIASQPSRDQVVDGKTLAGTNQKVKYGSVQIEGATQYPIVTGLEPKSNYVAYFVIRGNSPQSRSEVYCFQFQTGDVSTPVITLTESSPSVAFRSNTETANLNYALFAAVDLPEVFFAPMRDRVEKGKEAAFDAAVQAVGGKPDSYKIIDALMQSGSAGYSSLFDEFANATLKTEIQEYIDRSSGAGSPVASGVINNLTSKAVSKDFTDAMNKDNASNYYCLAVAQNVLGGAYTFKAVYPVFMRKSEPPEVVVDSVCENPTAPGGKYYGTVTFTFDEVLYYLPTSGVTSDMKPVYNTRDDGPDHVSFLKHIGGSSKDAGQLSVVGDSQSPSRTFTLKYEKVQVGSTIVIFNDGFISGVRGNSAQEAVRLRYEQTATGVNGAATYGWVIVP